MNRSKYIVQLAQSMEPVNEKRPVAKEDNGYESSPPPSLDLSLSFIDSDDSVKDPYYFPDDSSLSPDDVIETKGKGKKTEALYKQSHKINLINDVNLKNISQSGSTETEVRDKISHEIISDLNMQNISQTSSTEIEARNKKSHNVHIISDVHLQNISQTGSTETEMRDKISHEIISDLNMQNISQTSSTEIEARNKKSHNIHIISDVHLQNISQTGSTEIEAQDKKSHKINISSDVNLQAGSTDFAANRPGKKKKTTCKFCQSQVTNFERHLERNHSDSQEVQDMLSYPKKHVERKKIISLIRNSGNFKEYLNGNIRPKYDFNTKNKEYYPCSRCKALLSKKYLSRHRKTCILKDVHSTSNNISEAAASQTLIACSLDESNTLHKLRVKEQVFSRMKADEISLIAKTDNLIRNFGENYLKKHKREQLPSKHRFETIKEH